MIRILISRNQFENRFVIIVFSSSLGCAMRHFWSQTGQIVVRIFGFRFEEKADSHGPDLADRRDVWEGDVKVDGEFESVQIDAGERDVVQRLRLLEPAALRHVDVQFRSGV